MLVQGDALGQLNGRLVLMHQCPCLLILKLFVSLEYSFIYKAMSQGLSDAESALFHQLDAFAADNNVDLLAFWSTNRLCLTLEEFL